MNEKILIVDDDPNLLRLMGIALHRGGYTTVVATDGPHALQKIRLEKPDLVILDIMLPGVSGFDVCRELREDPETATLPIIVLSALTQVNDKIEGLQAGADEYLTKPVDPKEMIARVQALLQRTARLRQVQPQAGGGKVTGFIGAKGGVGTTTAILNVATLLAQQERAAIVAELRPHFGDFSVHLGHAPQESLEDILKLEAERINPRLLKMHLVHDQVGFEVLFGPHSADGSLEVDAEKVGAIIEGLATLADYILLDLPSAPTPATEMALRYCEEVILVLKPEPAGIQAAKNMLEVLRGWGIGSGIVEALLVNHAPLAAGMRVDDVASELGCEIMGVIPPAPDAFFLAQKQGRPLLAVQPQNIAAGRFSELVAALA